MLAGHYAAAYVAKAAAALPLWLVLLAAQWVDIVWAVLVLAGVERASLDFTLPSNPLVAESMPYSHSLVGNAAWAILAGAAVWRWRGSLRDGAVIGGVVVSHWFSDLIMHRDDLTLAWESPALGLQLWNWPRVAHPFELGVLLLSYLAFRLWAKPASREHRVAVTVLGVVSVVQLYSIFAAPPPSITQMASSLLVFWIAMPVLAAWLQRRAASTAPASAS